MNARHANNTHAGFTLLEVLIALAVVAIAMAAIIETTGSSAVNANHLSDVTFAHWVAMNRMAELKLYDTPPEVGDKRGDTVMAGRRWYWHQKGENTQDPDVRRVTIRVSLSDGKDAPSLTQLVGLFGLKQVIKPKHRNRQNNLERGDNGTSGSDDLQQGEDSSSGDDFQQDFGTSSGNGLSRDSHF